MLRRVSDRIARLEEITAAALAAAVTLLILLNIVTRSLGNAVYWVDELAIYAMVWMTFFGGSAILARRNGVAVTLLTDLLPPRAAAVGQRAVDGVVLVFAVLLLWVCVLWYDPVGIARAGFDAAAFQSATFNFIYSEPTNTLGIRKFWVWLVVPVVAVTSTLHALANLLTGQAPVKATPT